MRVASGARGGRRGLTEPGDLHGWGEAGESGGLPGLGGGGLPGLGGGRLPGLGGGRLPRTLHPVAWWIWALGLAVAISRTTNPLLLGLALAVLGLVVANRRTDAPWARAFPYYLAMALVVIALRVTSRTFFASAISSSDHILFYLPHIPTPSWYAGIQLGGAVSLEATLSAVVDGLRLGTLICCIGAANALANPKRALRLLPGALYELGMAAAVAISVAPQLVESVQRVSRARRLRGGSAGRRHVVRSVVIPVLEDALERSLYLAAAMDSRGYGRTGTADPRTRRITALLMLSGLLGLCVGMYGLLDGTAPRFLGLPAILAGSVLCCAGLALGGRRVRRTHYRPDPWRTPEWVVAGCGLTSAVLLYATTGYSAAQLDPTFDPLRSPGLPLLSTLALLLAAVPAIAAPPVTRVGQQATAPLWADPAEAVDGERRHERGAAP